MSAVKFCRGATREVLLLGPWAIKVPRVTSWRNFLHGLLANMQERRFSGLSRHLCPVLLATPGGWLLVMRRATPLNDAEWGAIQTIWDLFVNRPELVLPVERKRDSVGVLDRLIVAVDYGS